MRGTFVVHIAAGAIGLLSGYVALYSAKGGRLHRRSGLVFVVAMLAMCAGGLALALTRRSYWSIVNAQAALLTAYLVVTSFTTVRPAAQSRPLHVGLMLLAFAIGVTMLSLGAAAVAGGGRWHRIPAFPFFLFGVVGLLAGSGDLRLLRSGAPVGAVRVARHLWRMSFALLIAAMSFFLGQAKVIPKPIRIPGLLALPVLAVLVTMLYWLWRVRVRRRLRGIIVLGAPEAAVAARP